jgi:uncharacterized coiled-coil protein SlyX
MRNHPKSYTPTIFSLPGKMAREVCSEEYEVNETSQVQKPPAEDDLAATKEFDFVERPSEDFFCPVTFELLLNPHQTTCCGNHLSEKAVRRLQRDGKPCPMCKESELSTMPDKFHRRRVSAVHVRCPHASSGCEWVGEVGVVDQHAAACPKHPWQCQYCEFASTSDLQKEHVEQCTKCPVPCPNKCDVGMVPRCDVEKHRTECPLEPVACEFVDVGCSVKVARRDLKRHMEESQQQHLLSATLLNLKLTKETIAELNRQLIEKDQQLDKKDQQLTQALLEKDKSIARIIAEKDVIIAQKDEALAAVVTRKDKIIAEKESQLSELQTEFRKFRQEFMDSTKVALEYVIGTTYQFVLENFTRCQKNGSEGDWFSDPFSISSYNLRLNVETRECGPNMKIRVCPKSGLFQQSEAFSATLQLLNRLDDHSHHSKKILIEVQKGQVYSEPYNFIAFKVLYRKDATVQYLVDDSLKLRLWIKVDITDS